MRYDGVSIIIEELDGRQRFIGFNKNQAWEIYHWLDMIPSMRFVEDGQVKLGFLIRRYHIYPWLNKMILLS